jgi:hypothetical protein
VEVRHTIVSDTVSGCHLKWQQAHCNPYRVSHMADHYVIQYVNKVKNHAIVFITHTVHKSKSRDRAVSVATGYGPDARRVGARVPQYRYKFSLLHIVQTGTGVHTAAYPMGIGGKVAGA